MSRHLRPTAPQPPTEPGKVLLDPQEVDRALDSAGILGCGLFCRIVAAAQYPEPCTPSLLYEGATEDLEEIDYAIRALRDAGLIQYSAEGGAQ